MTAYTEPYFNDETRHAPSLKASFGQMARFARIAALWPCLCRPSARASTAAPRRSAARTSPSPLDRHGAQPHRPAQVAAGLPPDVRPARRASAPISCTARSSITYEALGSWRIAFVKPCALVALRPLGGEGKIVEADETYYGNVEKPTPHPSTQAAVPSPRAARGRRISALSSRWSSAAARPHIPCRPCRQGNGRQDRERQHRPREPPAYRRKQPLRRRRRGISPARNGEAFSAANTCAAT